MSDEAWRLATGYSTPDEANAALLRQAEQIKALADALEIARRPLTQMDVLSDDSWAQIDSALRLAGRLK